MAVRSRCRGGRRTDRTRVGSSCASSGSSGHQPDVPTPAGGHRAAVERVAAFCEQRSSDGYRIEHTVRGASITLVERRPPWNPDFGTQWTSLKIAQLRYDDETGRWRCTPPVG